jgi:hypothetical protein
MKSKKFDKRLSLNKKTVANLTNKGMNDARGGQLPYPPTTSTCFYCKTEYECS